MGVDRILAISAPIKYMSFDRNYYCGGWAFTFGVPLLFTIAWGVMVAVATGWYPDDRTSIGCSIENSMPGSLPISDMVNEIYRQYQVWLMTSVSVLYCLLIAIVWQRATKNTTNAFYQQQAQITRSLTAIIVANFILNVVPMIS